MPLPLRKRFCAEKEETKLPNSQALLAFLKTSDCEAWKQEIFKSSLTFIPYINPDHLAKSISLDQLQALKSITEHDGEEFVHKYKIFLSSSYLRNLFHKLDTV